MDKNLRIEDLTVEIKNHNNYYKALDSVTFQAKEGEIVGLVGESG